jgi:hypothetical protein
LPLALIRCPFGANRAKGTALGKPQRGDINIARGIAPGFGRNSTALGGKPQRGDINKARGIAPGFGLRIGDAWGVLKVPFLATLSIRYF